MSARTYSDRELACAHLRFLLGRHHTASTVRPDATDDEWALIATAANDAVSQIVGSVAYLLCNELHGEAVRTLAAWIVCGSISEWRAWVQRECAAELAAITAQKLSQTPAEQPAPAEIAITPTLTLSEFARVAIAADGNRSVRIEVFADGRVEIDGARYEGDATAELVAHYLACVEELRRNAAESRAEADRITAILAKAVTP